METPTEQSERRLRAAGLRAAVRPGTHRVRIGEPLYMKQRIARPSIEIFRIIAIMAAISATVVAAQAPSFLPTVITLAGNHTAGYTGDGGPAMSATLSNAVSGGTMDPAGNIYIADTNNNVIRKGDAHRSE